MNPILRPRSLGRTALVVAVLVALGACTRGCLGIRAYRFADLQQTRFAWTTVPVASWREPAKSKLMEHYLAIAAKKGSTGAFGFTRVPYDLWAPFDMSLVFGVFREDLAAGLGTGIFGVELDARDSAATKFETRAAAPTEFYGCFAQFLQGGLNVFVSKRGASDSAATNVGQHFFANTLRVEVFAAHDGRNLVFRARPADTTQAPIVIGTVAFVQGKPLNPGIGAFNIGDKGQIGFDRLEFGANGSPPAPVSPAEAAVADLFRVAAPVLHAHNLLDGTASPDTTGAAAALGDALARVETARTSIDAIPRAGKQADPFEKALARLILVQAVLTSLQQTLASGDDAKVPSVMHVLECKVLFALFLVLEPILPPVLALSLPGEE